MASLNENVAGVRELHPFVERSTLRRSVVNFQGTSFRWSQRGKTKAAGSVNENPQIPAQGTYRLARIPFGVIFRAQTLSETRGFMKTLIDSTSDRIIGFSMFGSEAGEVMASVQIAMIASLPFTSLRDAIFAHPTMAEGLIPLFANVPTTTAPVRKQPALMA